LLIGETVYRRSQTLLVRWTSIAIASRGAPGLLLAVSRNATMLACVSDDVALLDALRRLLPHRRRPYFPRRFADRLSAGWIEHGTSLYLDALRSELGLSEPEA
jgi:hypothetical protein